MRFRTLWLPLFAFLVGACQLQPADRVFLDGTVYTANDAQPTAEAVAVRDGRVVFVGSSADAQTYVGAETEVVDLTDQSMFPGFVDSHAHLSGIGSRELTLNLEGSLSIETLVGRLEERIEQAEPGEWVTGRGWIETHWTPRRFPTRHDLDAVSPNNPVVLGRSDGHAAVANSAALGIAGITRETEPPVGGDILKDAQGEPTGMLIDAARGLVERHVPDVTAGDLERAIEVGAERSVRYGWTQIQDAGGSWRGVARMRKLYGEGRIQLRVYKTVNGPSESADSLLAQGPSIDEFDGLFTLRTIKVAMDGALGSRGALLLEPYSDAPETHGLLTTNLERLRPMMVEALRRGIQVEAHAIGDSANRLLLNLIEEAQAAVPVGERAIAEPRWRDEHTQIVHPADLPRFKQLGVIPSMQASHAIGDLHFAPSRLGESRLVGAYAWRSLIQDGNLIAGGSDAPVERGEPLIEFYAAVSRRDTTGFQGPEWRPEERMNRDEALKSLTLWPAYAAFEEDRRGSIEVGKWADFTVFSADIMTIPEDQILQAHNLMTVINGSVVYRRE